MRGAQDTTGKVGPDCAEAKLNAFVIASHRRPRCTGTTGPPLPEERAYRPPLRLHPRAVLRSHLLHVLAGLGARGCDHRARHGLRLTEAATNLGWAGVLVQGRCGKLADLVERRRLEIGDDVRVVDAAVDRVAGCVRLRRRRRRSSTSRRPRPCERRWRPVGRGRASLVRILSGVPLEDACILSERRRDRNPCEFQRLSLRSAAFREDGLWDRIGRSPGQTFRRRRAMASAPATAVDTRAL